MNGFCHLCVLLGQSIADICHHRHHRRWCTFFRPVPFFALRPRNFGKFMHFWCTFTGLHNVVVSQNWQISGIRYARDSLNQWIFWNSSSGWLVGILSTWMLNRDGQLKTAFCLWTCLNWPGSGESDDEYDDHDQEKDHDALRDGSAHHDVVAAHPHRAPCGLHILLPHDLDKHQKLEIRLQSNWFILLDHFLHFTHFTT